MNICRLDFCSAHLFQNVLKNHAKMCLSHGCLWSHFTTCALILIHSIVKLSNELCIYTKLWKKHSRENKLYSLVPNIPAKVDSLNGKAFLIKTDSMNKILLRNGFYEQSISTKMYSMKKWLFSSLCLMNGLYVAILY